MLFCLSDDNNSEEMVKNVSQLFPKTEMASSDVKDNQFTLIEEERNQKRFTFIKLESENLKKNF